MSQFACSMASSQSELGRFAAKRRTLARVRLSN